MHKVVTEVNSIDVKIIAITATAFRNLLVLKLLLANFFIITLVSFSKGHIIVVSTSLIDATIINFKCLRNVRNKEQNEKILNGIVIKSEHLKP